MKAVRFESLSLDEGLAVLKSKVASLSRPQTAAFFGCIGTSLLPLYISFSKRYGWGDVAVLRSALKAAFGYATGEGDPRVSTTNIVELIAKVIPDEQEFEVPDSTFAMDTAICVDAAVRAADPERDVNPGWVEYALQPAITTLCERETGYLDLGSESQTWQTSALKNLELREAFEALAEMAEILSRRKTAISRSELQDLQRLADRLLPGRYA